jgi:hypothetical protein
MDHLFEFSSLDLGTLAAPVDRFRRRIASIACFLWIWPIRGIGALVESPRRVYEVAIELVIIFKIVSSKRPSSATQPSSS